MLQPLKDMRELKKQLQELPEKRFIGPTQSPTRAPVPFVGKREWEFMVCGRLPSFEAGKHEDGNSILTSHV